ncbi:ubiquinol-cytochrome C chaperone family protein [Pelagibacteraceae bacterium]|nr:ubiquinol-cytochrome C chaperone family protein [Pelagibacteraceae bacterium]
MIFKFKKHNSSLYSTLLVLSRNLHFYTNIKLTDSFEKRLYLMFFHFSMILIIFKEKKIKFPQKSYDDLFNCIENNLRELGYGDVAVNKKMKDFNKVFYDILLKVNTGGMELKINKKLVLKYFEEFNDLNIDKYELFAQYFLKFYHFCFELRHETMIEEVIKFKV